MGKLTHSEECWKWHPECAAGEIERLKERNAGLEEQAMELRGDVLSFSKMTADCIGQLKQIQGCIEAYTGKEMKSSAIISDAAQKLINDFTTIRACVQTIDKLHNFSNAAEWMRIQTQTYNNPKVAQYTDAVKTLRKLVKIR